MPTIAEVFYAAVNHHRAGDLDRAEAMYRQVLETDARNANAWHLLGLVAHARGHDDEAVELIRRAIEIDNREPGFHRHLAEVYRSLGDFSQAEIYCLAALKLKPDFAAAHSTLGAALHALGRLNEAVESYRRALAIEPHDAKGLCNLGSALSELGQQDEATACFRRAVAIDPRLGEAHFNLGMMLQASGDEDAAIESYQNAIRAQPDCVPALNNLGTLYKRRDMLPEAIDCYQRALEFHPDFAEVLNDLGNIFKVQGRIDEARVCYDQTLRIRPDNLQARCNRALMDLADGRLAEGWADYEYRSSYPDFPRRVWNAPAWRGEPLEGCTLLVHAEQGLGDTLQFVRYLPLLAKENVKLVLEVAPALVPILSESGFGQPAQLVAKGEPLPPHDRQVPLLSLPGVFGTTLADIPNRVPYLSAREALVRHWQILLGGGTGFKVGIAWQGRPSYSGDRFRSVPLVQFAPLALAGVELVSLQRGHGVEQLRALAGQFAVRDLGDDFDRQHGAFMDTAAVMRSVDLVVTSDTAVAHLAGALGARVWVALPLSADWRWLRDREDSPWSPTMRLFRQTTFDDWRPVFARIAAALEQLVSAESPDAG
jgi:tetratricopeptide (TPR) repeat protein